MRAFGIFTLLAAVLLSPSMASAYIGPGAGISAFGSVMSLLAAIALGIVGFVWYPIKRLLKARGGSKSAAERAPKSK